MAERTIVVHNGIDWARYRPTPPAEVRQFVPVDPAPDAIVLHSHRPEPSKGLPQTIAGADLLVHRHGIDNLTL